MSETPPIPPRPHRGTLILVFGILGIVISCLPLGIAAWVMGNGDLAAMQRGEMDRSGESLTNAGKVCGIVSVVLGAIAIILWVLFAIVFVAGAQSGAFK
jgi:hypothetical protein